MRLRAVTIVVLVLGLLTSFGLVTSLPEHGQTSAEFIASLWGRAGGHYPNRQIVTDGVRQMSLPSASSTALVILENDRVQVLIDERQYGDF
jgi:hypothetical protein